MMHIPKNHSAGITVCISPVPFPNECLPDAPKLLSLEVTAPPSMNHCDTEGQWQESGNLCTCMRSHAVLFLTTSLRLAASLSSSFCPGFTQSSSGAPSQQRGSPLQRKETIKLPVRLCIAKPGLA